MTASIHPTHSLFGEKKTFFFLLMTFLDFIKSWIIHCMAQEHLCFSLSVSTGLISVIQSFRVSLSHQLNSHSGLDTVPTALQMSFTELRDSKHRSWGTDTVCDLTCLTCQFWNSEAQERLYSAQANYILWYMTQLLMLLASRPLGEVSKSFWSHSVTKV